MPTIFHNGKDFYFSDAEYEMIMAFRQEEEMLKNQNKSTNEIAIEQLIRLAVKIAPYNGYFGNKLDPKAIVDRAIEIFDKQQKDSLTIATWKKRITSDEDVNKIEEYERIKQFIDYMFFAKDKQESISKTIERMFYTFEGNSLENAIDILSMLSHKASVDGGWWNDPATGEDLHGKRNVPEMMMLIVSEIAEAMEGYRKDLMDDKLSHHKMITVELADALLRIGDLAGSMNLPVGKAIREKRDYNLTRQDHKKENRLKSNGKKF